MRELFPHQQRALEKIPNDGGYLAFEQGLGKTQTAIAWAERNSHRRVLVVAPAVALGVWASELALNGRDVLQLEGTRKRKAVDLEKFSGPREIWAVVNYEVLLEKSFERAIDKFDPDIIVVDEAHKAKTATAKRSKVLHRLGKKYPALLLSGTPITKNLLDLYSQYKIIDPAIWGGESWTKFRQRYGIWGGYGGYELVGYQNADEIKKAIAPWTVVAKKKDTLDLPAKLFTVVPVTFDTSWVEYRDMAVSGVNKEWYTSNPLEKALRLSQITGRAKVQATAMFVRDLVETGEQVVVYARFIEELEQLSELLEVEALTGSTPVPRRTEMVENFQAGEESVFLSQITAGSVGITLTAASHMVYHSLTFAYEDWAQSQDRIHRIGQEELCNYYVMAAVGPRYGETIDHHILNAVQNKEDFAAKVLADPRLLLPNTEE